MLKIYHAPGTRSVRPIWLCYELGLSFDIETVEFTPEFLNSPQWRAISPAGKLPILVDGDLTMFESGAMVNYILDKYGNGRLRPAPGTPHNALYQQWAWFAESTLAKPLGLRILLMTPKNELETIPLETRSKITTCLDVVEHELTSKTYLLGDDFSAADIMMGYTLELVRRFEMLGAQYTHCHEYLNRLKGRDACQKAMGL